MYMYSLSPACKSYKGSNFALGKLLVPMWDDLDKKWRPGFEREREREQGWGWFQCKVVWTKGGAPYLGESKVGVGFNAGWFGQKVPP